MIIWIYCCIVVFINNKMNMVEQHLRDRLFNIFKFSDYPEVRAELSEKLADVIEFPSTEFFIKDDFNFNDKIAGFINKKLTDAGTNTFIYTCDGLRAALNDDDTKKNVWICVMLPKYPKKFCRLMKYYEFTKLLNEKNK